LAGLTGAFTAFLAEATALALPAALVAVAFLAAVFAGALAAAGRAFFSVSTWGFADFFIAFAIEFSTNQLAVLHNPSCALQRQ
jgi:hypothetical protein